MLAALHICGIRGTDVLLTPDVKTEAKEDWCGKALIGGGGAASLLLATIMAKNTHQSKQTKAILKTATNSKMRYAVTTEIYRTFFVHVNHAWVFNYPTPIK